MRTVMIFMILFLSCLVTKAEITEKLNYSTSIGCGMDFSQPIQNPFEWKIGVRYGFNNRFEAGIGTGLLTYEKLMLPLYGDLKFRIIRPRKITPYIQIQGGYGFALCRQSNGGVHLNPNVGVEYSLKYRLKIFLSLGYSLQKLERLKTHEDGFFHKEFNEKLSHNTFNISFGVIFQ